MIERSELTDADLYKRVYEAANGRDVLDVGAGLGPYHDDLVRIAEHVTMIDAHEPYLLDRKRRFGERITAIPATVAGLIKVDIYHRRFDLLLALDVVEHLPRDEAVDFIHAIPRIADRAILFIPEGDHPQTTDAYGMGGDHWQTHRSTWHAEDLEVISFAEGQAVQRFAVERWLNFHVGKPDPRAIYATWGM